MMYFWEFVQNLPLVAGLMLALQLWQEALPLPAVVAMITGSLLGATLIRLTEGKIIGQHQDNVLQGDREPIMVTLTNMVMMFIFMFLLTVYLTAVWSAVLTDILAGGLIGVALSAAQSKAAGRPIGWRHSLAFAVAFPAALIIIRLLSAVLPVVISILLITAIVTLIITFIDYGRLLTINEGAN